MTIQPYNFQLAGNLTLYGFPPSWNYDHTTIQFPGGWKSDLIRISTQLEIWPYNHTISSWLEIWPYTDFHPAGNMTIQPYNFQLVGNLTLYGFPPSCKHDHTIIQFPAGWKYDLVRISTRPSPPVFLASLVILWIIRKPEEVISS